MYFIKNSILSIVTLLVSSVILLSQPKPSVNPVLGSWELVKYVNHSENGTDWESYDGKIIYQKHITENYFTWIQYDKENDQLLGITPSHNPVRPWLNLAISRTHSI